MNALPFATEETYLRAEGRRAEERKRAVLTLSVGGEVYGIEILEIREIIKFREVTEVPRVPDFVLGVISVRGLVIPVLDLRLRLRLPASPPGRGARILVVHRGNERFGLLCDAVRGVVRFADPEIEPAPASLSLAEGGHIRGIGRREGKSRMVVLLDLGSLLDLRLSPRPRREGTP